jgi:hypothetical protein
MSRGSQFVLKLAISAMMALPTPLLAHGSLESVQPASSTEGVPVAFSQVRVGDEIGYIAVAPIPADQEQQVAFEVAQRNPDGAAVLVADANDPVLAGVKKSGFLSRVKVFVASGKNLPTKFKDNLQKVTDFAKKEKAGLMWAFYNASVISGFTYLASSKVDVSLAVLGGLFVWNTFLITQTNTWEKILNAGGRGLRGLFSKGLNLVGREMNAEAKNFFESWGQFGTAWAVNTAIAAGVLIGMDSYLGFAHAAWVGLLTNYNVWDAAILKKLRAEKISEKFKNNYFALQFLIGTFFDAANYAGVAEAQILMGITVVSGLVYLMGDDHIDRSLTARGKALRDYFTVKKQKSVCERMLKNHGYEIWGDLQ